MNDSVAAHYSYGQLLDRILSGVEAIGKTPESVTVDDLAPVDEFHIGGRQASEEFIDQLELSTDNMYWTWDAELVVLHVLLRAILAVALPASI